MQLEPGTIIPAPGLLALKHAVVDPVLQPCWLVRRRGRHGNTGQMARAATQLAGAVAGLTCRASRRLCLWG